MMVEDIVYVAKFYNVHPRVEYIYGTIRGVELAYLTIYEDEPWQDYVSERLSGNLLTRITTAVKGYA